MVKILVTGANGLLGQHLVRTLLENNFAVIATGRGISRLPYAESASFSYFPADLTMPFALQTVFEKEKPDIVIHAAAMTQVDECEQRQEAAADMNVQATINLLIDAESHSQFFIFLSTDFVFDGERGNYNEEDDQNPVSWYGFTKVQAESMVQTSSMPWAIVRTCLVYGLPLTGARSNIVSWIKTSLEAGKRIKVVNDQVRTPTYVEDLARGILLIAQQRRNGLFHIAGKDVLTPYEMAVATAELLQMDKGLIEKVNADSFSQPAKRPPKTGLDISKARRELGFEPVAFVDGLRKTVEEL